MNRYVLFAALIAMLVTLPAFCQEPTTSKEQSVINQPPALQRPGLTAPEPPQWRPISKYHRLMLKRFLCLLMTTCVLVHILTAVWVYQDIQRRHVGSGLWIVIALLTGLCGTLVYAVVRLGDAPKTAT
jgi:hypothetical protein